MNQLEKMVAQARRSLEGKLVNPPRERKFPQLRDKEFLREKLKTMTMREIAREVGCSDALVNIYVRAHGLKTNKHVRYLKGNVKFPELLDIGFLKEQLSKMTMDELAAMLGCNFHTVEKALHRFDIDTSARWIFKPTRFSNERTPLLYDRLVVGNHSIQDVADDLGVTRQRIQQVAHKQGFRYLSPRDLTWSDLQPPT